MGLVTKWPLFVHNCYLERGILGAGLRYRTQKRRATEKKWAGSRRITVGNPRGKTYYRRYCTVIHLYSKLYVLARYFSDGFSTWTLRKTLAFSKNRTRDRFRKPHSLGTEPCAYVRFVDVYDSWIFQQDCIRNYSSTIDALEVMNNNSLYNL